MDTNSISAIVRDLNPTTSCLALVVDGVRLDELLAARCNDTTIVGLLPTLLDWMDFPEERRITWERILPPVGKTTVAPLLMCESDPGLGCILLVTEVESAEETIHWRRFGYAVGAVSESNGALSERTGPKRVEGHINKKNPEVRSQNPEDRIQKRDVSPACAPLRLY